MQSRGKLCGHFSPPWALPGIELQPSDLQARCLYEKGSELGASGSGVLWTLCPSTLSPQGILSDSTRQDGDRESHCAVQAALDGKQHKPVLCECGKGVPVGAGSVEETGSVGGRACGLEGFCGSGRACRQGLQRRRGIESA